MEYRFLGSSGLQVSALSFGAWVTFGSQLDDGLALECMQSAIDKGVNFFDNAEAYAGGRAETVMGSVIQQLGWKRSDFVVDGANRRDPTKQAASSHRLEGLRKEPRLARAPAHARWGNESDEVVPPSPRLEPTIGFSAQGTWSRSPDVPCALKLVPRQSP